MPKPTDAQKKQYLNKQRKRMRSGEITAKQAGANVKAFNKGTLPAKAGRAGKTKAIDKNKNRGEAIPSGRNELVSFLSERGFSVNSRMTAQDLATAKKQWIRNGKSGAKKFNRFIRKGKGTTVSKQDQVDAQQDRQGNTTGDDVGTHDPKDGSGTPGKKGKKNKGGDTTIDKPDLGLTGADDIGDINSRKLADLLTRKEFRPQFREIDRQIDEETRQGESNIDQIGDFFGEAQVIRKRAAGNAAQTTSDAIEAQQQATERQIAGAQSGQAAAVERTVGAISAQFQGAASLAGQSNENFFNRLQGDLAANESKAKLQQQRLTGRTLRDLREDRQGLQEDRADAQTANFEKAEQLKLGRIAAKQNLAIGAALAPGQVALQNEELRGRKQARNQQRAQAKQQRSQNQQNQQVVAEQVRGMALDNDIKEQQLNDHLEARAKAGLPPTVDGLDFATKDGIKDALVTGVTNEDGTPKFENSKQTAASIAASMENLGFNGTDPATKKFLSNVIDGIYPGEALKRQAVIDTLKKLGWIR